MFVCVILVCLNDQKIWQRLISYFKNLKLLLGCSLMIVNECIQRCIEDNCLSEDKSLNLILEK